MFTPIQDLFAEIADILEIVRCPQMRADMITECVDQLKALGVEYVVDMEMV